MTTGQCRRAIGAGLSLRRGDVPDALGMGAQVVHFPGRMHPCCRGGMVAEAELFLWPPGAFGPDRPRGETVAAGRADVVQRLDAWRATGAFAGQIRASARSGGRTSSHRSQVGRSSSMGAPSVGICGSDARTEGPDRDDLPFDRRRYFATISAWVRMFLLARCRGRAAAWRCPKGRPPATGRRLPSVFAAGCSRSTCTCSRSQACFSPSSAFSSSLPYWRDAEVALAAGSGSAGGADGAA